MTEEKQRYRVIEKIDSGGMAEVYRGVAESMQGFKRAVAIKRILSSLSKNKKFITMFLDEARLSLQLQHANIVQVYDIGVAESYFIVMELVDGANLKSIIDVNKKLGRRLKTAQTLFIMMEVCKGLQYAHDLRDSETGNPIGIVHRDISPPNILISRQGEVKLVDFGLAKAASQVEDTEPGVVKGKFGYLSPEATEGQSVDRRADLFAVGILLWELLAGQRLFYGETDYQTVELVRAARIPSIRAHNPEVEPELEGIILKALARDPEVRYQQAADLGDNLAQYLFSRGMKVTSRDIAQLVQETLAEKKKLQEPVRRPSNLIDTLIQEEILKFTSIDTAEAEGSPAEVAAGSPARANLAIAQVAGENESFVDPRAWLDEETKEPEKPVTGGMPSPGAVAARAAPPVAPAIAASEGAAAAVALPAVRRNRGALVAVAVGALVLLLGAGIFVLRGRFFTPKLPAAAGSPK